MKPSPRRYPMLLTHGAAIFVGCLAGKILLVNHASRETPNGHLSTQPAREGNSDGPSAWVDRSLREVRAETGKTPTFGLRPATMADLLTKSRVEADAERKEYADRVDEILAAAPRFANQPDPAASIRTNLRPARGEEDHSLAIFQAWLDKDPDAALAELQRNRNLQGQGYLPALLERKYGREWLTAQLGNDAMGYQLRKYLAAHLGRDLAWEGGLEGLVGSYNSIPDPELKIHLAGSFAGSWPLDDPVATGRILESKAPPQLRESLMNRWAPLPGLGSSSFVACGGMPPTYATREWFDKVHGELHSDADAGDSTKVIDRYYWNETPKAETLEQRIETRMKAGDTREEAVGHSLPGMFYQVMGDGTDLATLFGDRKITREELMAELTRRIPESEAFPKELERAAWKELATRSEPEEVAFWAAELAGREESGEMLERLPRLDDEEPRASRSLELCRAFAALSGDRGLPAPVREKAAVIFENWVRISPAAAEAWRDALPENDPLRGALDKGKDTP